ncbi:MAG: hypothetical protein JWM95_2387 [Gemmatimonadetes bacterium]|nr:hypothetical protein [Gemmatimonadota bacterium]
MVGPEAIARLQSVQRDIDATLREVFAAYGWPGRRLVGDSATHVARGCSSRFGIFPRVP